MLFCRWSLHFRCSVDKLWTLTIYCAGKLCLRLRLRSIRIHYLRRCGPRRCGSTTLLFIVDLGAMLIDQPGSYRLVRYMLPLRSWKLHSYRSHLSSFCTVNLPNRYSPRAEGLWHMRRRLCIVRCYCFDPSVASIGLVRLRGRRWVGVDHVTCVGGGA